MNPGGQGGAGVRLAHLSDIHFGGENSAAVAAAASWLAERAPDLVVITGDVTAFGQPEEFRSAAAWTGALGAPLLITPGNHDTPYLGLVERLASPFGRFERAFGTAVETDWISDAARVATMNTARGVQLRWNWSKGAVSQTQTDRALASLAARAPGALAVVACHHPLVEMIGGPMTARVRGGPKAARRLCEGGVDLILTGHIHFPFAMTFPYGDGHAHAVGASTLSVRERGAPAGFNLIEAADECIVVTAQAWTGSHFEAWRTWSLPRRAARA